MKINIAVNSLKYQKEIPTSWEQVTFKQFLDLSEVGEDYSKVLSIFTGIDVETIKQAKILHVDHVIDILGFLRTPPDLTNVPQKILGYKIPKDLGFEYVAQYEDLKNYVSQAKQLTGRAELERYTLFCAVYACPYEFGDYHFSKAESIAHYFLQAPAVEVLAVGNFTYQKLIALSLGIRKTSLPPLTPRKKFRLALIALRKRMAFWLRFHIWKKKQAIKGMSFISGLFTNSK